MPTTIAQLQAVVTADTSSFTSAMTDAGNKVEDLEDKSDDLDKKAKSLGASFTQLGAALTAALTAPIAAAAALGVAYTDMQQRAITSFAALTGSAKQAQVIFAQVSRIAVKSPFDNASLQKSTQMLLAMGASGKTVAGEVQILADATAAVGGTSASMQAVAETIGKISSAATVSSHRINELVADGLPAWQILAKQMGTTVDGVRQKLESGAVSGVQAAQMLLDGMANRWHGTAEKMQGTWATTMSNLKDSAAQAFGSLFQPAIKAVSELLQKVSSSLFAAKAMFDKLGDGPKLFISGLLGMAAAIGPVLLIAGQIVTAIEAIGPVVEAVGAVIAGALSWPFLAIAAAVAAAVIAYRTNFLGFGDAVRAISRGLMDGVMYIWSAIQVIGGMAWDWLKSLATKIEKLLEPVAKAIKGWAKDIGQSIADAEKGMAMSDPKGDIADRINAKFAQNRAALDNLFSAPKDTTVAAVAPKMQAAPAAGGSGDDTAQKQANSFADAMAKAQFTLRLLRQGESKDLADLAVQYDTISIKRVKELMTAQDQIKAIVDEREARQKLADSIKQGYESARDKVLLDRDGSIENTISVQTYHKAIGDLTAAQRQAIQPTIDMANADKGMTDAKEAAKKAADDLKASFDAQAQTFDQVVAAVDSARVAYLEAAATTDVARAALKAFKAEFGLLSPMQQTAAREIADYEARTRALTEAQEAQAKVLKDQASEYNGLADHLREVVGHMDALRGQSLAASLALGYLKQDIASLNSSDRAMVDRAAQDIETIKRYEQYRATLNQIGDQIKTIFANAFESVLNKGQNVFEQMVKAFRQMLVRMAAEWAASKVVDQLKKLVDKQAGGGLAGQAKSAAADLTKAAASLTAAAALLDKAAKDVKSASKGMAQPDLSGVPDSGNDAGNGVQKGGGAATAIASVFGNMGGGMGGDSSDAEGTGGLGGITGAMSLFGGMGGGGAAGAGAAGMGGAMGGLGAAMPYIGAAEMLDQTFFHGQLTKWIMGGGLLGKAFRGLGHIFHFSEGSWSVPGSGSGDSTPAMLTPGEMVVPRSFAQGIREGGLFGGGDIHLAQGGEVHIHDKADVARIQATVRNRRQSKLRMYGV